MTKFICSQYSGYGQNAGFWNTWDNQFACVSGKNYSHIWMTLFKWQQINVLIQIDRISTCYFLLSIIYILFLPLTPGIKQPFSSCIRRFRHECLRLLVYFGWVARVYICVWIHSLFRCRQKIMWKRNQRRWRLHKIIKFTALQKPRCLTDSVRACAEHKPMSFWMEVLDSNSHLYDHIFRLEKG